MRSEQQNMRLLADKHISFNIKRYPHAHRYAANDIIEWITRNHSYPQQTECNKTTYIFYGIYSRTEQADSFISQISRRPSAIFIPSVSYIFLR